MNYVLASVTTLQIESYKIPRHGFIFKVYGQMNSKEVYQFHETEYKNKSHLKVCYIYTSGFAQHEAFVNSAKHTFLLYGMHYCFTCSVVKCILNRLMIGKKPTLRLSLFGS